MCELLSMVRQLGAPDFWHTVTEWPDLFSVLSRVYDNLPDEYSDLSYIDKCELLNRNPSLVARHFQHRLESHLKHALKSKLHPLGSPILNYAVKINST